MKKIVLLALTMTFVFNFATTSFAQSPIVFYDPAQSADVSAPEATGEEVELSFSQMGVLSLLNEARKNAGVEPVSYTALSQNMAQQRAKELASEYSHYRPDGRHAFSILYDNGFGENTYVAENIAKGYPTASAVMNAWLDSEGHRINLLGSQYTTIGIGVYTELDTTFWVQLFIGE